ncbi:alpha/beta hydrolase [Streptomyces sp. NPDC006872]|uniref:alpha/beta hydrolase n=1 Tax=Streptomyces sp. NPDC006872 TaxID=3155720 RepID=UPI0033D220FF
MTIEEQEPLMSHNYDPELTAGLAIIPVLNVSDLADSRAKAVAAEEMLARQIDRSGVITRDVHVPTTHSGAHDLWLRIHSPESGTGPFPLIYSMHGGGFCMGSLAVSDARSVELVREVQAVVVSVDYRLAPEHPYPTGLEDSYSGLVWVTENAAELGIDATRVAVHGQSAGGNLATALSLLARDRGGPDISFQYLGVPVLDHHMNTPSVTAYVDTPFWDLPNNVAAWTYYLGGLHSGDDVPIHAAPAQAEAKDLEGLPPAYVAVMQFDPLRDEGIAYAAKLAQAGVATELHLYPGAFHGSSFIQSAHVSQRERAEEVAVLRRALHE